MLRIRLLILNLVCCTAVGVSAARAQDESSPRAEAMRLARGWTLLASGDAAGASTIATQELARDPQNIPALVLAVEADLTRGGSSAALGAYEKWLGTRRLDEAYVLRRVARALLVESSGKQANATAKLEALRALAADGDRAAWSSLEQAASSHSFGETRSLAALGDERAIKMLIGQLTAMPGAKTPIIEALGNSGSKLAVAPLKTLLADPIESNRAAAADALGRLGATDAIAQLRPLLKDSVFSVKLKAAGALYRLNDSSGLSFLTELTASEHSGVRIAAARELAAQPDISWQNLVRSLANDSDPAIRLDVARLIAPYDLALANTILSNLMRDDNIGIREAASAVMVESVASDFATLRGLLRSADVLVRVKAAARILELTR